ncbi:hypothetical protein E4T43_08066 [Aureobasidium subglaciale]|nr:hypothetical protein E4T43_08066 [Aureobasidium subglaciale]
MHSTLITIHESPQRTGVSPKLIRTPRIRSRNAFHQRNTEKVPPHLPRSEDEVDTRFFPLARPVQIVEFARPTMLISVAESNATITALGSHERERSDDQSASLWDTSIALKVTIGDNAALFAGIMIADGKNECLLSLALVASLVTLINALKNLNDILVKHRNAIDEQILEIRTTIAESLQKKESSSMGILSSRGGTSPIRMTAVPNTRHASSNTTLEDTLVKFDQHPSCTIFLVEDSDDRKTPESDERQTSESETSSVSSQFETSLTSTSATTLNKIETCGSSSDYERAYTQYLVANLKRQKWATATGLRHALDKPQFLTIQLHTSMSPLHTFITILQELCHSSETVRILQEQVIDQQTAIKHQIDETRLAIRELNTNQADIRECEVLVKKQANSNLDLALEERLAINHLMVALAAKDNADIDKFDNSHNDELSNQQTELADFSARVRSLVESIEGENNELEKCIGDVNKMVHQIKGVLVRHIDHKSAIRKMLQKLLRRL